MSKKIFYIGGFQLPDKNAAAHRVVANAKIFKELGYEVIFFGFTKSDDLIQGGDASYFEGFCYYNLPYPKSAKNWLIYLFSISKLLKFIKNLLLSKPEAIIAYNYPSVALNKLNKFCNKNQIKLYADCTEWYEPSGGLIFKSIKSLDTTFRMKFVHPKLDGVIAISLFLFNYYKDRMSNVILLPPLVDKRMVKWELEDDKFSSDEVSLVYAGSPGVGGKDRLDKIISALSLIKDRSSISFRFIVIGLSREDYVSAFGNSISLEKADEFTVFKGRLSHLDSLKEIKNASYEIFIRDNNLVNTAGFPTKFVESISCGTPVIANISSNIDMYLHDGKNGFILDLKTPDKFVNSLEYALSRSKEEIQILKSNCINNNPFDYRDYIEQIRTFLTEKEEN